MKTTNNVLAFFTAIIFALTGGCAGDTDSTTSIESSAQPTSHERNFADMEADVTENPLKDAYFGELHLHTSYSLDSYIGGNRRTPDDAYRFAKGEEMIVHGDKHRLQRPLDFAAVTDHAEYIGEMYSTQDAGAPGFENPMLVELRGLDELDEQRAWFLKYVVSNARSGTPEHPPFYAGKETTISAWAMNRNVTNNHYEPGRFTTLQSKSLRLFDGHDLLTCFHIQF